MGFIIYSFVTSVDAENDKRHTTDLQVVQSTLNYVEFGGLIILLFHFLYHLLCSKKYNYASDSFKLLGQWSAFKLFYQFRPKFIISYLGDMYSNNGEQFENTLVSYCNTMLNTFNNTNTNNNNNNSDIAKCLYSTMKERILNDKWTKSQNKGEKAPYIVFFVFVWCLLVLGMILGVFVLILKLSEVSFVSDDRLMHEWSFSDWFKLSGFCFAIMEYDK